MAREYSTPNGAGQSVATRNRSPVNSALLDPSTVIALCVSRIMNLLRSSASDGPLAAVALGVAILRLWLWGSRHHLRKVKLVVECRGETGTRHCSKMNNVREEEKV